MLNRTLLVLAAASGLVGCDKVKDAAAGGAQESYCEALCTWSVECAADARDVDADALMEECLAATRSVSASCADAEDGSLNAAQSATLSGCTDAIAAKSGECDSITGLDAQVAAGTPPGSCTSQSNALDTFHAAQDAVIESGPELCDRFYSDICGTIDSCIQDTTGFDYDAVGTAPYDLCLSAFGGQISECASSGKYDRSSTANPDREVAQECLENLGEPTCGDILSGDIPATCATALGDSSQLTALTDVIQQYATR